MPTVLQALIVAMKGKQLIEKEELLPDDINARAKNLVEEMKSEGIFEFDF